MKKRLKKKSQPPLIQTNNQNNNVNISGALPTSLNAEKRNA
jgi:hypothetical protein